MDGSEHPNKATPLPGAASGPPQAPEKADENNALEALKLLKDWSTWLAAIETAIIGAIGALSTGKDATALSPGAKFAAAVAALLATASLGFACFLFLGLPGVAQRLPPFHGNDIFHMRTGGTTPLTPKGKDDQKNLEKNDASFCNSEDRNKLSLGWFARGQVWSAFLSILAFAIFVITLVVHK
jgi:hypothetical protein